MGDINAAEPLIVPSTGEQSSPPLREPWRFWGTALWTVLAAMTWMVAQFAIAFGLLVYWDIDPEEVDFDEFSAHAGVLAAVALGSTPIALAVIALAVRIARWPLAEYLALVRPARRDVLGGLIAIAVLLPLLDLVTYLSGRELIPVFMLRAYTTALETGTLPLLVLALVVAAPVGEEIVFRGFIFRGWAASWLGAVGTIAITALIWASMHVQYETFLVAQIFCAGLVLGWLRWRSGSVLLTIALHAIINAVALMQTAAKVHGLI
jgi:membrane protease YdiL (CAAX protease family)